MGHAHKQQRRAEPKLPRIVLDTNVLVGAMVAHVNTNTATRSQLQSLDVLRHCTDHYQVCFTADTLKEFEEVCIDAQGKTDCKPCDAMARLSYIGWVKSHMKMIEPMASQFRCRDRKDQMILEAAVSARADYLISRDGDILELRERGLGMGKGYQFIHPADFMRLMDSKLHTTFVAAQKRGKVLTFTGKPVQGHKQRGHQNGVQKLRSV